MIRGNRNAFVHDIARFRSQLFDRMLRPYGLTSSQAWVLAHLLWQNGLTQTELARRMQVGTVTLGGLVDRLEARGLVERRSDPDDRRANRVFYTDSARPVLEVMNREHAKLNKIAYAGLSPAEIKTLTRQLAVMRANLLAALSGSQAEPGASRQTPEKRQAV